MKFLNQYELLEPVTGGTVETFTARNLSTGERLVVHLFSVPDGSLNGLNAQGALQIFMRIAPTPLGAVVAGGRYEQTSHAYLVTKLPPDPASLQDWIGSYQAHERRKQGAVETQNLQKSQLDMGEFTRAFLSAATADVDLKTSSKPEEGWANRPAGPFTKEFLSGLELPPENPGKVEKAPAGDAREAFSFTAEFLVGRSPQPKATAPVDQWGFLSGTAVPDSPIDRPDKPSLANSPQPGSDTGEFTRFFSGPFADKENRGAPSELNELNDIPTPRRQEPGDFTRVFGPVVVPSKAPDSVFVEPSSPAEPKMKPFETPRPVPPRTQTQTPPQAAERTAAWDKEIDWSGPSARNSQSPSVPPSNTLAREKTVNPVLDGFGTPAEAKSKGAATEVFKSPSATPPPPAMPTGPSEYTRIISARPAPADSEAMPPAPPPAAPATPAPSFSLAPPPPLAAPKAPKLTPPKITAPKVEGSLPTQLASYWPLIIVMNVLLILAIALVLYFALKH